jgi:hypothetical protein
MRSPEERDFFFARNVNLDCFMDVNKNEKNLRETGGHDD